ncbi:MAG: ATPase domain-containing protein [Candidatus Dormibacteria bacterium]
MNVRRLSTGLPDLDAILGGGLPVGSLVVFAGAPGAGKTILAQQICFHNATSAHKAIYYSTITESPEKLANHMGNFEFFDRASLVDRVEFINLGDLLEDASGESLNAVIDEIVRKCAAERPVLVAIDSAEALRDFSSGDRPLRAALYRLATRIAQVGTTLLFLGEYDPEQPASVPEHSLADGIIELVYESREPSDLRWLRVLKMRGAEHLPGRHPMRIGASGVEVVLRAETVRSGDGGENPTNARIRSGIQGLDEMTGGGLPVGSATIVLGPSGCGKTALALAFVGQGLKDGERCLYVSFQEEAEQLIQKAASFGTDLEPAVASGQLKIHHVPETDLNIDVIASVVRDEISQSPLHRVVIDSLAEMVLSAQESARFPAYTRALLSSMRAAGVSVLTTSETNTLGPTAEPLGGLAFLYHNVVMLRYLELESTIGRGAAVLKMRDSAHFTGLRQFSITSRGFEMAGDLRHVSGLLGWSVLRQGEPSQAQERRPPA